VSRRFFVWAAVVGVALDRIPKLVVHGMFVNGELSDGREVRLLGDVLKLTYAMNPHGLFSMNYGPPFMYLLLPLSAAALVAWYGLRAKDRWSAAAFGLILSGALGNVIDRVGLGYVIDFLRFGIPGHEVVLFGRFPILPWPVFNAADALVLAGVAMLLGQELLRRPRRAATETEAPEENAAITAEGSAGQP
jgi:signal peptidase II